LADIVWKQGAITLCFTVFLAGSALAQPGPDCTQPHTPYDKNVCSGEEAAAADAKLNQAYGSLQSALGSAKPSAELRGAQRAWISLRDKECAFEESLFEGGSNAPYVANTCVATYTKRRTAELERLLKCEKNACY